MGQLSRKLRNSEGGGLTFWCPGCEEPHGINAGWTWNRDTERPTFTPSVLVTSGHYMSGHSGPCWCTFNRDRPEAPAPFLCHRCHSFVTDGQIQFLTDSTHALAGQTVPLPDLPPHMRDRD